MNFFPTKRRKWPGFCERKLEIAGQEVPEYYCRMAVCNLLNARIDIPLDAELVLAGENEVSAAKRMVERLCANHPRLFDVVVGDNYTPKTSYHKASVEGGPLQMADREQYIQYPQCALGAESLLQA